MTVNDGFLIVSAFSYLLSAIGDTMRGVLSNKECLAVN